MERVWAREDIEVMGMRWERVACCADTRRSHSRPRAVARCGFEGGIRSGNLVVGFRTGRLSRWIMWLFSGDWK